jgi:hypothetical protein
MSLTPMIGESDWLAENQKPLGEKEHFVLSQCQHSKT